MKRIIILFSVIFIFCPIIVFGSEKPIKDSTSTGMTKNDVAMVMKLFDGQELSVIKQKADQLIYSASDSLDQAFLAYSIFEYYQKSKIMGYEEIALYVADNWFLNKRLTSLSTEEFAVIKMFADFNRSSMIGMLCPELAIPDSLGNIVSVRNTSARYKLLFFYDDQCNTCKAYTPKLMKYLKSYNSDTIAVFRIYTQSDRARWTAWTRQLDNMFKVSDNVKVYDVWDPDFSSDFPRQFGVVSTPQMILLNSSNFIIGRKLDPNAVATIIDMDYNRPNEIELFLDNLFTSLLPYDSSQEVDTTLVISTIDDLYQRSHKDTSAFQEIFLTTYKYLKNHSEYNFQRGAAYLAKRYIVNEKGLWKGKDNQFFSETTKAVELFYRNELGKPATNLFLTTLAKSPYSIYDSKAKVTVLYFYNMDCALCEAVSKDMKQIYSDLAGKDFEILAIYTGNDKKKWPKYVKENGFEWVNLWDKNGQSDMFAKYDLSGVPAIYILDENKVTIAKDITPSMLKDILNVIL